MSIKLTNQRVVAVDGGTATGKGRLIEELSQAMRFKGVPVIHLSTGSIYRAVTYVALGHARVRVRGRRSLSEGETLKRMIDLVREMSSRQLLGLAHQHRVEMHGGMVWLDGAPALVDEQLKGPGVGNAVSIVAAHQEVRELINQLTRRQVNEFEGYLLIDGRDITHVVVPDAPLKLLLTVAPQIAAGRSREHTMEEIIARDEADRAHKHGALRHSSDPGEGVIVLSTDSHTPESLRDHVYGLMQQIFPELPELK